MRKIRLIMISLIVIGLIWFKMVCFGCARKDEGKYHYLNQGRVEVKTEEIRVYTDVYFSDKERMGIWEAIERWNLVLNGYKAMIDAGGYDREMEKMREAERGGVYLIMRLDHDSPLIKNESNSMTLGFTDSIGGRYLYLVPVYIGDDLYGVVLHEIGHLMGARHTESGLMKAGYNPGAEVCIDKETVIQLGYDWERMNYCVRD